jgi:hypothetical protein
VGPITAPITSTRTSPAIRLTRVQTTTVTELRAVASHPVCGSVVLAAVAAVGSDTTQRLPSRAAVRPLVGFHVALHLIRHTTHMSGSI